MNIKMIVNARKASKPLVFTICSNKIQILLKILLLKSYKNVIIQSSIKKNSVDWFLGGLVPAKPKGGFYFYEKHS